MTDAAPAGSAAAPRTAGASCGGGFFAGGDRRIHLEQLRRPANWSRRLLLVTGPRGVGKSALYRQLSASLDPRVKAARINAGLVHTARDVLAAMIQGFALAAPVDASERLHSELIAAHAAEQERAGRCCLALIDDAEQLDGRALDLLVELAAASPLRLVLFGEVRLVPAVQRAAQAADLGWHEIRLTGFGAGDVRGYLEWRYREQGHDDPLPFSDTEIREIARLSEGLPARIDQMANVLLARIQSGGGDLAAGAFPRRHLAVLAALAGVLILAWLVWPGGDGSGGRSRVETLEVPPLADTVRPPAGGAGQPAESAGPPAQSAGADEVMPATAAASSAENPAPADSASSAENAPPPEIESSAEYRPAAAASAATARDAATRGAAARDAAARGPAWVMSRPGEAFTLQLGSFSSAERAEAYLARQAAPQDFATFRQQRDGRILHVVIQGEYPTREAAEAAVARLPDTVGDVEPWIRTFQQVQAAARTALQQ